MPAQNCLDDIHPSVIVDIAEGRAAAGYLHRCSGVPKLKMSLPVKGQHRCLQIMNCRRHLVYIIHNMALHHEEILPAVVIEILQPHAPA